MTALPVVMAYQLERREPEQRWLIEELWGADAVGIIGGEPKCGKSILALSMAVSVASKQSCLSHYAVHRQGCVLLYAAEDAQHIVRERLEVICKQHLLDLSKLDLRVITSPSLRLDIENDCTDLAQTVEQHRPVLLILDPFVRLHRGVDENASAAIAPLLDVLRQLQRKYGCAVILVHHARKNASNARAGQALRGSSEFHAWSDSSLFLRWKGTLLFMSIEHRACASPQEATPLLLEKRDDAFTLTVCQEFEVDQPKSTQSPQERVIEELNPWTILSALPICAPAAKYAHPLSATP